MGGCLLYGGCRGKQGSYLHRPSLNLQCVYNTKRGQAQRIYFRSPCLCRLYDDISKQIGYLKHTPSRALHGRRMFNFSCPHLYTNISYGVISQCLTTILLNPPFCENTLFFVFSKHRLFTVYHLPFN